MASVTQRIEEIKQPRGGYLKTKCFVCESIEDDVSLYKSENIEAGIVGMVVDYLTRFLLTRDKEKSFEVSILGAKCLDISCGVENIHEKKARILLDGIKGIDVESVVCACKLVGYDVCYRKSVQDYKTAHNIIPDEFTTSNIVNMVNRTLKFLSDNGPVKKTGFTFEGGYTEIITSGDGDYLTADSLLDLKVSKNEITTDQTLQLLTYYLMGKHSGNNCFNNISKLGIFNPRKNKYFWTDVSFIPQSTLQIVSREVIGYDF